MHAEFWHQKWAERDLGFHQNQVNPVLVEHFAALALSQGARIFLPLCGKTLDIGWLLAQGYQVAGVELSEVAVQELFSELGLTPQIQTVGSLKLYQARDIDIFVGDIFQLTGDRLGPVDAIYDRAALVALPADIRPRYAKHLVALTQSAPQLVLTFDYDQTQIAGPPFSISSEAMTAYYSDAYILRLLAGYVMEGLKGQRMQVQEQVWFLSRKTV